MAILDEADIQGFVLSSYAGAMPCANYLLLKITDAASCRRWLSQITGIITTGKDRKSDFSLNIAFTAAGFSKLGFTANDLLTFSAAFQEGMSTPVPAAATGRFGQQRSGQLGMGQRPKPRRYPAAAVCYRRR